MALFRMLTTLGLVLWMAVPSARAEADPLAAPLLFVKRFNYQGLHIYDTFYQWRPGGGIYVLENPADPADQRRVRPVIDPTTPGTLGEGIYFDPSLSFDATRLLFCFKGAAEGDSSIYEINVDGSGLRRISDPRARAAAYHGKGGGHHDVTPCYLPDGRIVFTSTAFGGLVPCANNGVAILHVMNGDGSDIHPISVNNVTEFNPSVLPDGSILFGRWEYVDRNALVIQSLWTIQPDGRNETELFGNHLVFPEALLQAKPVPGSPGLVVATFAPHNAPPRGTIAMVNTSGGKNDVAAIHNFESPDRPTHDRGESCDPWPLDENRVLFSGVPPEKDAPAIPVAEPGHRPRSNAKLNALMLIERDGRRRVVVSDPAIDLHNPIPLVPRPLPATSLELAERGRPTGSFYVRNVYASLPGVERGAVKWLRVLEETSRGSASPGGTWMNQTFSISAALAWSAKIYHGVVPVEEDGSVFFEAPAGRALYFQLLDQNYRLVRGMRTFIQATPGVTRSCTGCHEYNPGPPDIPLRIGELRQLQPESWGSGYLDYSARIQPIFDQKCVSCHGGAEGMAAGLDLSRGWTEFFNISYEHLTARRERMHTADLIAGICAMNGTADWSCKSFGPYSHGSGKAPLADILLKKPHREMLTDEERERIFAWIDSNGAYFGTWDYTDAGPRSQPFLDAVERIKGVMAEAGCARCHADESGAIRRFDQWINLDHPKMSRVLRAPLPASTSAGGGYGLALCRDRKVDSKFSRKGLIYGSGYAHAVKPLDQFPTQVWPKLWPPEGEPVVSFASPDDRWYRGMLDILQQARQAQLAAPRIDMPGADRVAGGIREGQSVHRLPPTAPDSTTPPRANVDDAGTVRLTWDHRPAAIGLVAEIHRGPAGFEPSPSNRIGQTTRGTFVDWEAPAGSVEYAVVLTDGCAAGCVPAPAAPRRSQPARVAVEVPGIRPALAAPAVTAEAAPGRVILRWAEAGPPGLATYDVIAWRDGDDTPHKLNAAPLAATRFEDPVFHGGKDAWYAVTARAPRHGEPASPAPGARVRAHPLPLPRDPVFSLAADGARLELRDGARLDGDCLIIEGNGHAVLPAAGTPPQPGPFAFTLEVMMEEGGTMPVLLGCGRFNGEGWFLQRFQGRWRFHLGGASCDGGTAPMGEWTRVSGAFDGAKLRLFENGRPVAEAAVPAAPQGFRSPHLLGQYPAEISPPFQFKGRLRRLALFARPLDDGEW